MEESPAIFLRIGGLRLRRGRSDHSSAAGFPLQHDRLSFRELFASIAMWPGYLLGLFPADAPIIVTRQRSPLRCGRDQDRGPKSDSSHRRSLQFRRQLADQALDLFCLMTMTNQNCIASSYNDEVMNSEQGNRCPI